MDIADRFVFCLFKKQAKWQKVHEKLSKYEHYQNTDLLIEIV